MTTDTATKLREYLHGERDWSQADMARECLEALEQAYREGYSAACEGRGPMLWEYEE